MSRRRPLARPRFAVPLLGLTLLLAPPGAAQIPDLPPAALPFSAVMVSTQIAPNALLVGLGAPRPTQGIVLGAAEIETAGIGNLCFATNQPSIGVTSGFGTLEFEITGDELYFAGADVKCNANIIATAFGITDQAIGTIAGGNYAEFALPEPPEWAAGLGVCSGDGDIKVFELCVVTENYLVCVVLGVRDEYFIPGPRVAPPFTWSNGQIGGVLLLTDTEARVYSGGEVTVVPYPGVYFGYAVEPAGVTVQTSGGDVFVPLATGMNLQAFGARAGAAIDFNVFGCPGIGAVNFGWNPGGIRCPPVQVVQPGGPMRGMGVAAPQLDNEAGAEPGAAGAQKTAAAAQDTLWIADWNFDGAGSGCNGTGWIVQEIVGGNPACTGNPSCNEPVGLWARLFSSPPDNDACSRNTTCAWIFTDHTTPTLGLVHAFGPSGGTVIHNWIDNVIVSPWVSLVSTPSATATTLAFRTFPGNDFRASRIVDNFAVRSRHGSTAGPWRRSEQWRSLGSFRWETRVADLTPFVEPGATEIQVRYRVADWQEQGGGSAPTSFDKVGPGPYLDRVRIGRRVLTGPSLSPGMDTRRQAQDAFPTLGGSIPGTDIYGSAAFSSGADLASGSGSSVGIEDQISIQVLDARGAGGITGVALYCSIVAGPHAGKAPPPYSVNGSGFFVVTPVLRPDPLGGSEAGGRYFAGLDDEYFRGGDVVHYFWLATDASGGITSYPPGIASVPASVAGAAAATGGLLEVSFLPRIDWDPAYVARIGADTHGKLEPTAQERANSTQSNCILYVQRVDAARRSGDTHRTAFMYTLDRMGYRDDYDVYDLQGSGNTNNDLGSRATVAQLSGYSLVVHDVGPRRTGTLPDGSDPGSEKIDQAAFYRAYLAQGLTSAAGAASLWMIGTNILEEGSNLLFQVEMSVTRMLADLAGMPNPHVAGVGSFTFVNGHVANFAGGQYALDNCSSGGQSDVVGSSGTGVVTHKYATGGNIFDWGAVVMNRNDTQRWNTVFQSHAWSDIRDAGGAPEDPAPELDFARAILQGVLPLGCQQGEQPTGVPDGTVGAAPARTILLQNLPNPANPTTYVRFELAQREPVHIEIFDIGGRRVRDVVRAPFESGRHAVVWDGRDDAGREVASGIYLTRFVAGGARATRKLALLR